MEDEAGSGIEGEEDRMGEVEIEAEAPGEVEIGVWWLEDNPLRLDEEPLW